MTVLRLWLVSVALLVARGAAAHPCPTTPTPAPKKTVRRPAPAATAPSVTSSQVLDLYMKVGRALAAANKADADAATELMQRYRLINISAVLANQTKRAAALVELDKLHAAAKKLAP